MTSGCKLFVLLVSYVVISGIIFLPYCVKDLKGYQKVREKMGLSSNAYDKTLDDFRNLSYTDGGVAPHGFKFIIENEKLCSRVQNLTYFIFVFTRPHSFTIRTKIRETWGQRNLFKVIKGCVAFLLGSADKPVVNRMVTKESRKFGDIIQQDFLDSYRNLSLKGIMASQWISSHCKNARYIIKVDDDVLLNIIKMMDYLFHHVKEAKRSMFCYVLNLGLRKHFVVRPNTTQAKIDYKFVVTRKQFAGDAYPEYCHGMLWVATNDIFGHLYNASFQVPFVPTEDAFTTGILRNHVGDIKIFMNQEFYKTVGLPINDLETYRHLGEGLPIAVNVRRRYYEKAWELMLSRLPDRLIGLVDERFWKRYKYKFYRPYWFKPPP